MGRSLFVLTVVLTLGRPLLGKGDGTLTAPVLIPTGSPGPVTIHAGDLNGDGKLDLVIAKGVASNQASGSGSILVLFQSSSSRLDWTPVNVDVGSSSVFVRAADFDGDGIDDIIVADTSSTAYFVRSRGDQTFGAPRSVPEAQGARWIAVEDWNQDGLLDIASGNLLASNVTAFLGDGGGDFLLSQVLAGSREHTLEASDYNGDGIPDLILGSGLPGVTPHKGKGDGTFTVLGAQNTFSCVEYIATGDFNGDGLGDLATTCIDDGNAYAGISLGNGRYSKTLGPLPAAGGTESVAIGDLDGDLVLDTAVVSNGSLNLWVYPGKGNGGFLSPVIFWPTGADPVFLIAHDLDGDGRADVVSGDEQQLSVSVFWGREGPRFLSSNTSILGFSGAKALAIADLDGDGSPDLLIPHSTTPKVQVYLNPRAANASAISLNIPTANKYTSIEAVDLDGDGIPDVAGASSVENVAPAALLSTAGTVRSQTSYPTGLLPGTIAVGRIDDGPVLDLAAPASGASSVTVLLGNGDGTFANPLTIPSIDKPKKTVLADLDGDGKADLVVLAQTRIGLQFGKGAGDFDAPVTLVQDTTRVYTDVAAADLTGDGILDVVVAEQKTLSVLLYPGKGNRAYDPVKALKLRFAPLSLVLGDLDGDGFLDITVTSGTGQSASVAGNRGGGAFGKPVDHLTGLTPLGHRLGDLDGDGALDLVAFGASTAAVLFGHLQGLAPGFFVRGDSNGDRRVDVSDAVGILVYLFAGRSSDCKDSLDADDDGQIAVADAVRVLEYLFRSGQPPSPPFPDPGSDPTPGDALDCPRA